MLGASHYNLRSHVHSTVITMTNDTVPPFGSNGEATRTLLSSTLEMTTPLVASEARLSESAFSEVETKARARFSDPSGADYC